MKKILLAMSVLAMGAATASAADLPARYTKAPPPPPVYNWTGFYIGANGGIGLSTDCRSVTSPAAASIGCERPDGGFAGGQIGYRWQTGQFVFGLEGQGDWANIKGHNNNNAPGGIGILVPGGPNNQLISNMSAYGLVTAQAGYAINNLLLYVDGGAAFTRTSYAFATAADVVTGSTGGETRTRPVFGLGFDVQLVQNWTVGASFNHIFDSPHNQTYTGQNGFASVTLNPAAVVAGGGATNLFAARLNYRFGAPVVANY